MPVDVIDPIGGTAAASAAATVVSFVGPRVYPSAGTGQFLLAYSLWTHASASANASASVEFAWTDSGGIARGLSSSSLDMSVATGSGSVVQGVAAVDMDTSQGNFSYAFSYTASGTYGYLVRLVPLTTLTRIGS